MPQEDPSPEAVGPAAGPEGIERFCDGWAVPVGEELRRTGQDGPRAPSPRSPFRDAVIDAEHDDSDGRVRLLALGSMARGPDGTGRELDRAIVPTVRSVATVCEERKRVSGEIDPGRDETIETLLALSGASPAFGEGRPTGRGSRCP
ncbi:hypothetical protein [Streptomyces sp. NPDC048639]|uniref:hypothetical protein n=1 Tax=Streptomyces sp. NPDC048639 TaxID=3365581 RepID=UPI003715A622